MLWFHKDYLRKIIAEALGVKKAEDISLETEGLATVDWSQGGGYTLDVSKLKYAVRKEEDGKSVPVTLSADKLQTIMKKINGLKFKQPHAEVEKGISVNLLGQFTTSPESDVAGRAYFQFLEVASRAREVTSADLLQKIKEIHADKELSSAFADIQFCNSVLHVVTLFNESEISAVISKKVPPMTYEDAIKEITAKTSGVGELISLYQQEALTKAQAQNKDAADKEVQKKLDDLKKNIEDLQKKLTDAYNRDIYLIQKSIVSVVLQGQKLEAEKILNDQQKEYLEGFNKILEEMQKKLDEIAEKNKGVTERTEKIVHEYDSATSTLCELFGIKVTQKEDGSQTVEASDQTPNKLRELGLDFKDLSNPEIVTEKLEAYLKTERGKTDISLAKNINLIKKFLGHDPSHSLGDEDASSLGAFGG